MFSNININSKKVMKILIIVYAAIILTGIMFSIFGSLRLDINFRGGARLAYSYEGDLKQSDFEKTVKSKLGKTDFSISQNEGFNGGSKTYVISISGKKTLNAETQEQLTNELKTKYEKYKVDLAESNSVSPSVAGTFLLKSLVAVIITALLVVVYVGLRFKRIGGVSAALTALCALVLDLLVTFSVCAIFRLQIDSNYMAVVLTILGYSLNDTIVVYDRVRETNKYYPQLTIEENMNRSIKGVMIRNIVTSVTTIIAVLTIIVVAEIYGLTSLRTFGIPMAFGLISGCFSSLFIAGPLWVCWKQHVAKTKTKKKA